MYSEHYPTPSWHKKIFIDSLQAIRLRQQNIRMKSSYMCRLGISFRKVVLVFLWKHFGRINTVCFPKSPCFSSSECFSNNSYSCNFEVNWCCCFFQCSFHSRPTCSHFCVHVTQSCREMSRDVKVLTDKYLWKVELLNSPYCHVNLRKRKSWKDWTQFFPCFLDQNDAMHQLVYSWELSLWRMRSQSCPHRYHQSSGYSRILNKYFNSQWRLTDKVMHLGLYESFLNHFKRLWLKMNEGRNWLKFDASWYWVFISKFLYLSFGFLKLRNISPKREWMWTEEKKGTNCLKIWNLWGGGKQNFRTELNILTLI